MQDISTQDRIDQIFAQIKAQEAAKKEKYLVATFISISAIVFLFVSFVVITNKPDPIDMRTEMVVTSTPSLDQEDEFFSEEGIQEKKNETEKINVVDFQKEEEIIVPPYNDAIKLEIKGDQLSESELKFEILNYDPSFIYRVDFGNGEGKIVKESFSYKYEKGGSYNLRVTAYGKNNQKKKYNIQLDINPWENALNMLLKAPKSLA
ncbi:MAG: PKD domain-containing protein [Bacteroidia bacterium]|nr:PKD domain-containing protein [Bacteroidia bacterium]